MSRSVELWNQEFSNNSNPSWLCSKDGTVIFANACALDVFGSQLKTLEELFVSDAVKVQALMDRYHEDSVNGVQISVSGKSYWIRVRMIGPEFWLRLRPFQESMTQDIRLVRLGGLSGGLFHAIRNPLTVVQGRVELLQMMSKDEYALRTLSIVYEQCERIASLLDTVQQITLHAFQATQFSLATLLRNSFGITGVEQFQSHSSAGIVYNDENRLRIAFEIVVEQIQMVGGTLKKVSLYEEESRIKIEIWCDVHENTLHFFKGLQSELEFSHPVHLTTSTHEQHMQMLNVILTDCNVLFRVSDSGVLSFTLDAHEVPSNKLKILVVDDDDTLRETVVALLNLQGHHIVTTNTAEDAQELWDKTIDVVLLDVNLPNMSGTDLLDIMEIEHPSWLKRVILISGIGTGKRPAEVQFLQKPFSKNQLNQHIDHVIRLRQEL
jgi:CheY-like chemotaxis protein